MKGKKIKYHGHDLQNLRTEASRMKKIKFRSLVRNNLQIMMQNIRKKNKYRCFSQLTANEINIMVVLDYRLNVIS